MALRRRPVFVTGFLGGRAFFLLVPYLGRNFFPSVDAGNILMHVRTQSAPASRRPPTSSPKSEGDPQDHSAR